MGFQATSNHRSAPQYSLRPRTNVSYASDVPPPGAYNVTDSIGKQVSLAARYPCCLVRALVVAFWRRVSTSPAAVARWQPLSCASTAPSFSLSSKRRGEVETSGPGPVYDVDGAVGYV
jgi:hypothetical protein